jgi:hypothetical protein
LPESLIRFQSWLQGSGICNMYLLARMITLPK